MNASDFKDNCEAIWTSWNPHTTFNNPSSGYFTDANAPAYWPTVEVYVLDNAGNVATETLYPFKTGDGYRFHQDASE